MGLLGNDEVSKIVFNIFKLFKYIEDSTDRPIEAFIAKRMMCQKLNIEPREAMFLIQLYNNHITYNEPFELAVDNAFRKIPQPDWKDSIEDYC